MATIDSTHSSPPVLVVANSLLGAGQVIVRSLWLALAIVLYILVNPLVALVRLLLVPVLFIISPFVYIIRLTLDILVFKPYGLVRALSEQLYDVWVFLGIALVFGIALGILLRTCARGMTSAFLRLKSPAPVQNIDARPPEAVKTSANGPRFAERRHGGHGGTSKRREWRRVG
jgi:hypothetical protein